MEHQHTDSRPRGASEGITRLTPARIAALTRAANTIIDFEIVRDDLRRDYRGRDRRRKLAAAEADVRRAREAFTALAAPGDEAPV